MPLAARPSHGACDFAEPGDNGPDPRLAFWRAACDPDALTARAEAVAPGDPDALDLFSLDMASIIVRSGPEREYLLADGAYRMRFELRGTA